LKALRPRPDGPRLLTVIGLALFLFGAAAAAVVFAEVQVLNSVYYVGSATIRFSGFPYGNYQVATGTCLDKLQGWTPDNPVCAFFNYDQLLILGLATSFVGFVLWRYFSGG
jgi:hypothetical protein